MSDKQPELVNNSTDNSGENNNPELLTRIRDMYTLSTTQNAGEVDELMVKHFLNTLAEVALSVAARKDGDSSR
jgi:hypothetical protein